MPSSASTTTQIVGRFDLLREIGRGSTGRVFAAWDRHLEREVAIKVLDQHMSSECDMRDRFDREIASTSRLQHPGIAAVFGKGVLADGAPCYVMTLAQGRTLDVYLDQLRQAKDHWLTTPLLERLGIFRKILAVVSYAHSQDVVHRDLKPANIMLGRFGEVWILDWGLARDLTHGSPTNAPPDPDIEAYDRMFGGEQRPVSEISMTSGSVGTRDPGLTSAVRVLGPAAGAQSTPVSGDLLTTGVRPRTSTKESTETLPGERTSTAPGPRKATEATVVSGKTDEVRSTSQAPTRRTSGRLPVHSTQIGDLLGSPAYMSPEQARGQAGVAGKASDIYSLGVILFELLTLTTPSVSKPSEGLKAFVARVALGDRSRLTDLWPEAPRALDAICESALGLEPSDRFATCDEFSHHLRELLAQLANSYSELERQRLTREQEGLWTTVGSWSYHAEGTDRAPVMAPPLAVWDDPIPSRHESECDGLVLGQHLPWSARHRRHSLQIYPVEAQLGDDFRMTLDCDLISALELWIFVRGIPPSGCYQFKIGAWGGRWTIIGRNARDSNIFQADILTTQALGEQAWTVAVENGQPQHLHIVIEMVGGRASVELNDLPSLVYDDPEHIPADMTCQLGLGVFCGSVVVHELKLESRRSPLLIPTFEIANELLRQHLFPLAIDAYRRFLTEHAESPFCAVAHFMLCIAYVNAGEHSTAEHELREFLSRHIDHRLGQDAILELAKLFIIRDRNLEKAVRTVLSYQESGDVVRSRLCHLLLLYKVRYPEIEKDAGRLVRQLIRGSPDEAVLLSTMAMGWKEIKVIGGDSAA